MKSVVGVPARDEVEALGSHVLLGLGERRRRTGLGRAADGARGLSRTQLDGEISRDRIHFVSQSLLERVKVGLPRPAWIGKQQIDGSTGAKEPFVRVNLVRHFESKQLDDPIANVWVRHGCT